MKIKAYRNHVLVTAAIVMTMLYVGIRTNVYHLSYRISSNLKKEKELLERNKKLKIEGASLKSPSRIGRIASRKFKLKLDSGGKVILINKNDSQAK